MSHGVRWSYGVRRSKELRIVGSSDRKMPPFLRVLCTISSLRITVGTKRALVFSRCLPPLRWPTGQKRVSAPFELPRERESPTTGHGSRFANTSRTAQRNAVPGWPRIPTMYFLKNSKMVTPMPICLAKSAYVVEQEFSWLSLMAAVARRSKHPT